MRAAVLRWVQYLDLVLRFTSVPARQCEFDSDRKPHGTRAPESKSRGLALFDSHIGFPMCHIY
jgi:hypothetical protein